MWLDVSSHGVKYLIDRVQKLTAVERSQTTTVPPSDWTHQRYWVHFVLTTIFCTVLGVCYAVDESVEGIEAHEDINRARPPKASCVLELIVNLYSQS